MNEIARNFSSQNRMVGDIFDFLLECLQLESFFYERTSRTSWMVGERKKKWRRDKKNLQDQVFVRPQTPGHNENMKLEFRFSFCSIKFPLSSLTKNPSHLSILRKNWTFKIENFLLSPFRKLFLSLSLLWRKSSASPNWTGNFVKLERKNGSQEKHCFDVKCCCYVDSKSYVVSCGTRKKESTLTM